MEGQKLWDEVFSDVIEEWGEFNPYELEELDGVTCYDTECLGQDGWYIGYEITFRYKGAKYSIQKEVHASDNVCDTNWHVDTFEQVFEDGVMMNEINKIISNIEDESYHSFEDIVKDLEELKKHIV
jgi:hypothetical protein